MGQSCILLTHNGVGSKGEERETAGSSFYSE
jgi:hypothetical protein